MQDLQRTVDMENTRYDRMFILLNILFPIGIAKTVHYEELSNYIEMNCYVPAINTACLCRRYSKVDSGLVAQSVGGQPTPHY